METRKVAQGDELDGELFRQRHERPGDVFMEVLEKEKLIVAPGVYDAMGAQIARQIYVQRRAAGQTCTFNAVYGSGWAVSGMLWALPDNGFHDLTTFKTIAKHIIRSAHPLPVILDAETGFGNYVTLTQTVEAYHEMGVALAHLEDQRGVRRCGNHGGKECESPEDMVAKIRSWLRVSKAIGTSMRLMARTDALTASNGGLENAIERGKRYMDTDYQGLRPSVLWADAMMDPDIIEKWVGAMHRHDPDMILGINYSPNKDWTGYYRTKCNRDPPTYADLHRSGFNVMWHTILQARADMEASYDTFNDMADHGAQALWRLHERQRNHPVGDCQGMTNVLPWQRLEKELGGESAVQRFEKSQGYKGT